MKEKLISALQTLIDAEGKIEIDKAKEGVLNNLIALRANPYKRNGY